MRAFDEVECNLLAKALDRAYLAFMASGRLNERNLDIVKPTLSRAIMHHFQLGERDEFKLAKYAQMTFNEFRTAISERDLAHLKGTSAESATVAFVYQAL